MVENVRQSIPETAYMEQVYHVRSTQNHVLWNLTNLDRKMRTRNHLGKGVYHDLDFTGYSLYRRYIDEVVFNPFPDFACLTNILDDCEPHSYASDSTEESTPKKPLWCSR